MLPRASPTHSNSLPTNVSGAFPVVQRVLREAQGDVDQLSANSSPAERAKIGGRVSHLEREVRVLYSLVEKEPEDRREGWRWRIQGIEHEVEAVKRALGKIRGAREVLLEGGVRRRGGDSELDSLARENDSLRRANQDVDTMTSLGRDLFHSAREQGTLLKRARGGMLDIANSLGLSKLLATNISKREQEDRMIVYVGMVLTLLFLGLLYYIFRY